MYGNSKYNLFCINDVLLDFCTHINIWLFHFSFDLHFLPLNSLLYNHVFSDKLQICFINVLDSCIFVYHINFRPAIKEKTARVVATPPK